MGEQITIFGPDMHFTKMSPEPSAPTKEKTSASSLKRSQGLKTPSLQFLDLQMESGGRAEPLWVMVGALPGAYSIHSFGEHPISLYHNGVGESHLLQILEDNPHMKYCLSAKACQGILNRANRKGKKLPRMLQYALEQMIATPLNPESQDEREATSTRM